MIRVVSLSKDRQGAAKMGFCTTRVAHDAQKSAEFHQGRGKLGVIRREFVLLCGDSFAKKRFCLSEFPLLEKHVGEIMHPQGCHAVVGPETRFIRSQGLAVERFGLIDASH